MTNPFKRTQIYIYSWQTISLYNQTDILFSATSYTHTSNFEDTINSVGCNMSNSQIHYKLSVSSGRTKAQVITKN